MVLAVALAKDTAAFLWTTMVAARVPSRNAAISPTKAPRRARSSVHGGGNTAPISLISRAVVSEADWPKIERDLLVEDTVTLVVQVNGKKRGEVTVASNAQNPEIEAAVLALDAVKQTLGGNAVRKVIVVPMRIVNVVG